MNVFFNRKELKMCIECFSTKYKSINSIMTTVYFKGIPCHIYGNLPHIGERAPSFILVGKNLDEIKSMNLLGKQVLLNIFPSFDTGVCAMSVRRFNEEATKLKNTVVLCVSMDLPFAASRFCAVEGIENVFTASAFRAPMFSQKYGMQLIDGPLEGLFARSIVIIDKDGIVKYTQLVEEITNEPDYSAAIVALDD